MELEAKQQDVAGLIDGEVVDDSDRVAVCIKGTVNGFKAQLEAFMVDWPFNVTYVIETVDRDDPERYERQEQAKVGMLPRMGRGFWSFFAHIFLFEGKGQSVNDKRLEKKLIFSYDNRDAALRIIKYPGIPETIQVLEEDCQMKEMIIKTDAGVYFVQGTTFKTLDLDLCKATFNYMAQIAQVMNELF